MSEKGEFLKEEEIAYRFTPKGLVFTLLLDAGLNGEKAMETADRIFERLEWECIRICLRRDKQWTDKDLPAIVKDGEWDFQKVQRVEEDKEE